MKTYPCVLTIAGSDCSGGAGIQADIKTISALGAYAASVITAITVQNTLGVTGIHPIPASYVKEQIEAVMKDIKPTAVKIGMVNDAEIATAIAETLKKYHPKHIILDPVMVSTSGSKLLEDDAIEAVTQLLMPQATLITPNLSEAEVLVGKRIQTSEEMQAAASALLKFGCQAVLVKGGHLEDRPMIDVLQIADESTPHLFSTPKIESQNTHGTGCTLSSAIATQMALGKPLSHAVALAKTYVYQSILQGKSVHCGDGHGPVNHFHAPIPMHIFTDNEKHVDIQ